MSKPKITKFKVGDIIIQKLKPGEHKYNSEIGTRRMLITKYFTGDYMGYESYIIKFIDENSGEKRLYRPIIDEICELFINISDRWQEVLNEN
jgi:hypothetical protein